MKKRILSVMLIFCVVLALLPTTAWAANSDFTIENGVLTKYNGPGGDIIVPNNVTRIGDGAFSNCSGLTSVTISGSVTSIGSRAFYECVKLNSVVISNSVTTIGSMAFAYCRSLTSVIIPNSVTSIGHGAFYDCVGLTSVTVPSSITKFEGIPFAGCDAISHIKVTGHGEMSFLIKEAWSRSKSDSIVVEIENGITNVVDQAFLGCSNLTSVIIPDSITSIGNYAFSGCSGLTSVTIPDGVTNIGDSAFSGCSGLTSVIIPNSVTNIGRNAFSGCNGLTSVTISNNITSIPIQMFYLCSGLTDVTIPDGVTHIGGSAFLSCSGLTSVTIPKSVISVEDRAFDFCSSLADVYYGGTKSQWNKVTIKGSNGYLNNHAIIHYTGTDINTGTDTDQTYPANPSSDITIYTTFPPYVGGDVDIFAVIRNPGNLKQNDIKWSSSNEAVATVTPGTLTTNLYGNSANATARVHGISSGKTTITVTTSDGRNASYELEVTDRPSTIDLKLSDGGNLLVDGMLTCSANIRLTTVDPKETVVWTTSNSDIVAFDRGGSFTTSHPISNMTVTNSQATDSVYLYGRAPGEATVTCKLLKSGEERAISVKVYTLEQQNLRILANEWLMAYNAYIASINDSVTEASKTVASAEAKIPAEQLEKVLQSKYGVTLTNANVSGKKITQEQRLHICAALLSMLAEETETEPSLSGISTKKLELIPVKIVNNVANALQNTNYHYEDKKENVTVDILALGFGGGRVGTATYKKFNKTSYETVDVVITTSREAMEQIIADYAEELLKLDANVFKRACQEAKKELMQALFGKGASSLTEKLISGKVFKFKDTLAELG